MKRMGLMAVMVMLLWIGGCAALTRDAFVGEWRDGEYGHLNVFIEKCNGVYLIRMGGTDSMAFVFTAQLENGELVSQWMNQELGQGHPAPRFRLDSRTAGLVMEVSEAGVPKARVRHAVFTRVNETVRGDVGACERMDVLQAGSQGGAK